MTTIDDILLTFREGKLTPQQAAERLRQLKAPARHPLSEGQKGLWMLQTMQPAMSAYNLPLCFRFRKPVDVALLRQACRHVAEQHPLLASIVEEENGVPYLKRTSQAPAVDVEDISAMEAAEVLPHLERFAKAPFVLQEGPLMRVRLYSRSADEQFLLIVIHHIVFDGRSVDILVNALFSTYEQLLHGAVLSLPRLEAGYGDFVEWEQKLLNGPVADEHRAYWMRQLAGPLAALKLPSDAPRHLTAHDIDGRSHPIDLSSGLSGEIKAFCSAQGVSVASLFLSVFKVLLHRYTGETDVIVGMPTLGRAEERFEPLIGFFVNTVSLRSEVDGTQPMLSFLRAVQFTLLDALDHAEYPFRRVVRDLKLSGGDRSPLFQVLFEFKSQNVLSFADVEKRYRDSLGVEPFEGFRQEGEYELVLEVMERADCFALNVVYDGNLFERPRMERMAGHLARLLEATVAEPERAIAELPLMGENERQALLAEGNDPAMQYPQDRCLHELFSEQARLRPDTIAANCEGDLLTYQELDTQANQLAHHLRALGVGPEVIVGLCVERSLDIVIGIMGILKAGGAYLPLDPDYPNDRMAYMLSSARVPVLITQAGLLDRFPQTAAHVLCLDRDAAVIGRQDVTVPESGVTPENLAYVIYTSGSTGSPNGAMITHACVGRLFSTTEEKFHFGADDVWTLFHSYAFDFSVWEIWGALLYGGRVVVVPRLISRTPELFYELLYRERVTVLNQTPSAFNQVVRVDGEAGKQLDLRWVIFGGESLSVDQLRPWMERHGDHQPEIINMYGITETTVFVTHRPIRMCDLEGPIPGPIGGPLPDLQCYVLDERMEPVPIGLPGELYVGGPGLGRGYLNNTDLTIKRFVANPFVPGARLYRSGDLVRPLGGGELEFLGRVDFQVKIRGHRIELGEIEAALVKHERIREAVVLAREEESGQKRLVAYVVVAGGGSPDVRELRDYLKRFLPEYMVPAAYVPIVTMPLNHNGKADRKVLARLPIVTFTTASTTAPASAVATAMAVKAPDAVVSEVVPVVKPVAAPVPAPTAKALLRTEIEERVLAAWKSVLNVEEIDPHDGFFDVGGDSILAVTLSKRISEGLEVPFNVTSLFKFSSIKSISDHIAAVREGQAAAAAGNGESSVVGKSGGEELRAERKEGTGSPLPDYYLHSSAIIGISCQFPGAADHSQFWKNLGEGKESIEILSPDQLRELGVSESLIANPKYVAARSTIEGKELFDAKFFDISPHDAEVMDPQLRHLLLHSWRAVEDAGYVCRDIADASVFMSASTNFYGALSPEGEQAGESPDQYVSWALSQGGAIPTAISYRLGLGGRSIFVHSNCSSSLVGLEAAHRSLLSGESRHALVGASTLFPFRSAGYLHQNGMNFSSDGHVRAFDAAADGMIGGEGAAVIVLKRAVDAIADGDHIYALVRGIAVNNDGAEKAGYYAPSVQGQARVIEQALHASNVDPESIGYVETHGTGTRLGDPIEFAALSDAYRKHTTRKQFCGIGSVKTNVGHLDTAAGLAGTIKVALSLAEGEIPATLHFVKANAQIDLESSPFYVADSLRAWRQTGAPRRAAVSSFGIGGTNAHAILEEPPVTATGRKRAAEDRLHLVPLSARTEERLIAQARNLRDFLAAAPVFRNAGHGGQLHLDDLAYTLQVGREPMACRVVFLVRSLADLSARLEAFVAGNETIDGCFHVRGAARGLDSLIEEHDSRDLVKSWIEGGQPAKAAKLWVTGFDIDWKSLYRAGERGRISLPTYPFELERFWSPRLDALRAASRGTVSSLAQQPEIETEDDHDLVIPEEAIDAALLLQKTVGALLQLASSLLKQKIEEIGTEVEWNELGFDSISLTTFANRLNETYRLELTPTIFFEHPTVRRLAVHLAGSHAETLAASLQVSAASARRAPRPRSARKAQPAAAAPVSLNALEPIAIVGVSGRFPQAPDLDTFWQNLEEGRDCISEIPKDRWDWEAVYGDPSRDRNKTDQKWGGFIEGIGEFDPLFFGISPREAELMDPHQRLLMMYVWKVIEDAGYSAQSLSGSRTAIFAGTAGSGYEMLFTQADLPIEGYSFSGVIPSIGPGRMSYFLNFHGPSEPIETACSSSLVAIHRGLSAIYNEQCDSAIVGGINTIVSAPLHISVSKAGMLADDGRCKTFSSRANGYVRGEGVGMLMLKRLSAAERDGDHIYALIRATAENHGGRANSMTAPNPQAQVELLTAAYTRAGIDPRTVSYIEAHGTGTALGDPIEVNALKRAFADLYAATGSTSVEGPHCGLGSVKTNVGHLELAAGVAGVMKVLLQLQHGTLVKSLHSAELNPYIQLEGSPFYVVREAKPWARLRDADGRELPRRAGVSSFGIGGVNAHVVIEEYLRAEPTDVTPAVTAHDPAIIILSAKNEERLAQQAAQLLGALEGGRFGESDLPAIAYTLQIGREAMEARMAMTVVSIDDLRGKLTRFLAGEEGIEGLHRGSVKRSKDPLSLFAADEDLADAIEAWVEKRKYARLLELWVSGMPFDWTRLYGQTRPRRVALPTYPFARDRYWPPAAQPAAVKSGEARISTLPTKGSRRVPRAETASRAALRRAASLVWRDVGVMPVAPMTAAADLPRVQEPLELMTFEESWAEAALTVLSAASDKPLVCFLSDPERQQQAAQALRALAPDVQPILVSQGERYERHSTHHYAVPFADGGAYSQLLASIREEHGEVAGVLYLWPLEERQAVVDPSAIVHLVKAIAGSNLRCPRLLLAGELDDVGDRAYFESWMGFERSLGLVLPNTRVTVLFEQLPRGASTVSRMTSWLARLWQELLGSKPESAFYRQGLRHVTRVLPTVLSEVAAASVLRDRGTYLITGGAGGLGLMFASHLATTRSANLILTGRSGLDAAKQASIDALTALGAQVLYLQADIADAAGMRAGVQRAVERFGAIHGAIHAAGVAGELSILDNDLARFHGVLEPKVAGTLVLDEALSGQPLDFICYFSSSSAIIGDFGGCDYAMANRFELAYADARNEMQAEGRRQGKALAISWPHWKEGGMSAAEEDSESARLYLKSSGQRLLEREEGLAAFERLLGQSGQRHIVMTGKRSRVHHFLGVVDDKAALDVAVAPATVAAPASKGRRLEMAGLTTEQCVAWDLKEHASILVKIPRERLDADENLADFGFDSIGLGEFAKSLGHHYGIDLTPSVFFSHPTLARLAEHLIKEHAPLFEAFYRHEAARPAAAPATLPVVKAATGRHLRQPRSMTLPAARRDTGAPEPIAIIGMSGRFPQARSVDEMWQILATARDAVTEIPQERFDWRKYYGDPRKEQGKTNCKWSGAVPGVDEFDAMFFEITPLEAETMDPRQRLLLQEAWKALEDAGYGSAQLGREKVGMFVGVEQGDYQFLVGNRGGVASNNDAILAARLSYFLNLRGPSMAINTTCSSGLVAAHEACLSLRTGECDTAIAAGVNLMLTPFGYLSMGQAGMLSPDGRCYAFDERANGMVPGEAVVVVVLKRLAQAVADGDPIHAVIRGSGVNYDGKTNGITAPSGAAQTNLLREVYERTRTNPREIEYVVTHGTGTKLGDPVEINALYDAFKPSTEEQGFCALTSTKSNFGHTFAASGLVSLVSLVQAMKHETIPASLHCQKENDYIQWSSSPFYVNKSSKAWPKRAKGPRVGALSAFGMSGTNAHMVVESYDVELADAAAVAPLHLLALSAKTADSLAAKVQDLLAVLEQGKWDARALRAMSHTLLSARQHFEYRCALVVADREIAIHLCRQAAGREKLPNLFHGKVARHFTPQSATLRYAEELLNLGASEEGESGRYQETLYALADLYCQGYDLPWERLFGAAKPRRIALPTYPFERERHWVASAPKAAAKAPAPKPPVIKPPTVKLPIQGSAAVLTRALLEKVYQGAVSADQAKGLLHEPAGGNGATVKPTPQGD